MGTDITPQLVAELESIKTDALNPLEQRLIDTAVWFHKNKDRMPGENLPKRLDFLFLVLDTVLEILALTVDRMQQVEGRGKSESLWLPNGITYEDDEGNVKHFRP